MRELDNYLWELVMAMRSGSAEAHVGMARMLGLMLAGDGRGRADGLLDEAQLQRLVEFIMIRAGLIRSRPESMVAWIVGKVGEFWSPLTAWRRHDLDTAILVQLGHLSPLSRRLAGIDLAWRTEPFDGLSGDYFNYHHTRDGLLFLFGDVRGKGTHAALSASRILGALEVISKHAARPAVILSEVNRLISGRRAENEYTTLVAVGWNPQSRRLRVCNGGNVKARMVKGAKVKLLRRGGPPPGLMKGAVYSEDRVRISAGEILVLISDGLSEQPGETGEYGDRRAAEMVLLHRDRTADAIVTSVWDDFLAYAGNRPTHDDRSLAVLKFD